MQILKKSIVCMADTVTRAGLSSILKEMGHVTHLLENHNSVNRELHRNPDYLIVGDGGNPPIVDQVLSFSQKIEPKATAVLVKMLKLSEVDKLKSVGVNAILSISIKPAELAHVLALLPEHWIVNTGIAVPDGLASISLTEREWQILSNLAVGNSVKQIAAVWDLSVKTIETHKFNLMRKLDVHYKADLIVWYMKYRHLWAESSKLVS